MNGLGSSKVTRADTTLYYAILLIDDQYSLAHRTSVGRWEAGDAPEVQSRGGVCTTRQFCFQVSRIGRRGYTKKESKRNQYQVPGTRYFSKIRPEISAFSFVSDSRLRKEWSGIESSYSLFVSYNRILLQSYRS